jgi:7SK snRNA methylphosphate capping enzyme
MLWLILFSCYVVEYYLNRIHIYLSLLGLIETAKWNLRRIMRQDKVATNNVKAQKSSDSPQSSPEELASELSNGNKHQDLFKIVSFRRENFVASMDGCSEQYDTILW